MGERKRKQVNDQEFRRQNPWCAYCGAQATTVDHFPPRAAFRGRQWPEGYRFASCDSCNSGTSHDELVVSSLVRLRLRDAGHDDYTSKLLQAVKNNRPDVIEEWRVPATRNETREIFRRSFGPDIGDALRRKGYEMVTYGDKTRACIQSFGEKLLRALYFKHVGLRMDGLGECVPLSLIEDRDAIRIAAGHAPFLQHTSRGQVSLSDQFVYRFNASQKPGVIFILAQLGDQLGYMGHGFSKEFCDDIAITNPGGMTQVEAFYKIAKKSFR